MNAIETTRGPGGPPGYQTIGILGGMGPEATKDLFDKIIRNTRAARDQEHLPVVMVSLPQVPDRTAAILGTGESPVPTMIAGCRMLEKCGVDFAIIPCVSAHYFIDELRRNTRLPILAITEAVAAHIAARHTGVQRVGLLATDGTLQGGHFTRCLNASGLEVIAPDDDPQRRVMGAIYEIKNAVRTKSKAEITRELVQVAEQLVQRGAQGIVAGCTEIPLALNGSHLKVPFFDSLELLALAAIQRAGGHTVAT